jgi:hypothetical protein
LSDSASLHNSYTDCSKKTSEKSHVLEK